jgi:hypothetical protein
MNEIQSQPTGIGEEQLNTAAPLVRSLVVQRLEKIWRACEPHIDGTGGRPDPRFVEAGVRVLDRLMRLYRLDSPQPAPPVEPGTLDMPQLLEERLKAVEARVRRPEGYGDVEEAADA